MSERVKIQLSLSALERLIGGNTEAEVELRSGVVQEFAKRHLKGVANAELMNKAESMARSAVNEMIGMGASGAWGNVVLYENTKKAIMDAVNKSLDDAIYDAVSEARKSLLAKISRAKASLERGIAIAIAQRLDEGVKQTIKDEINARVKTIITALSEGEQS